MKIFLFQKNELDIIDQWVEYHSRIVGYNNLVVIDHMSNDGSYQVLLKYVEHGLTLLKYNGPYVNKGKVLTGFMKKYQSDIVIPLDADEFIVCKDDIGSNIISDPLEVRKNIDKLVDENNRTGRYRFGFINNLANIILYPELKDLKYFEVIDFTKPTKELGKSFFCSKYFISTDLGNHVGQIKTGSKTTITPSIGLLHYKVRGVSHYSNKTKKAQEAFNFSKKGSTSSSGRHWRIDYEAHKESGAEAGFSEIHLFKGDISQLLLHNLFPLPERESTIDDELEKLNINAKNHGPETTKLAKSPKVPRVWKKRVQKKRIKKLICEN